MFDEIKSKFQNSSTDGLRKNLTMSLGPARTCSKDMFVYLSLSCFTKSMLLFQDEPKYALISRRLFRETYSLVLEIYPDFIDDFLKLFSPYLYIRKSYCNTLTTRYFTNNTKTIPRGVSFLFNPGP